MNIQIRPATDNDMDALVELSLLAWAPVFSSFEQVLGPRIYSRIYPDWRRQQSETVLKYACPSDTIHAWVAEVDGSVAGFISYELNHEEQSGEVDLLAVHPAYQNQGIGTELNNFVLAKMRESGMRIAVVGTGGDEGHAPARRCYEKAGYTGLPLVRYYQAL